MNPNLHRVIGIDLGTTYSAVASYNTYNDIAEVLPNMDYPNRPETTPSVISIDKRTNKVIVGWPAKNNIASDPDNTIIEIKREMGELFSRETLEKYQGQGRFRPTLKDGEGRIVERGDPVHVQFAGGWRRPQEISAFTLMKMKEVAEKVIGTEIIDAVITVPAYFREEQKQATQEAARLAGLYPLQLIPEPTAAAICYGLDQMEDARKVYLVYDLGGGTFDVSVITVQGGTIEVIATRGDARLGGGDFDDRITKWAVEQLAQPPYNLRIENNRSAREIIKAEAERAKRELSNYLETDMTLGQLKDFLKLDVVPILHITRAQFEEMIQDLLDNALKVVIKAIELSKEKDAAINIDAILMVGGSSRIPRIHEQLLDYFQQGEEFIRSDANPDEVVARGAAIMARRFAPSQPPFDIRRDVDKPATLSQGDDEINVTLITEHNLGVGVQNDKVSWILEAGTQIPVSETRGGYTNTGPVTHIPVQIFQGEDDYIYGNTLVGTLQIGPMEPRPKESHQFEVTFSLSADGLLSTEIFHVNENKRYKGEFKQATGFKVEELADIRNKLLQLYQSISNILPPVADVVPPPPPTADVVPPPPPPADVVPPPPPPASENEENGADVIEVTGKFPEEFQRVVRRARKLLVTDGANHEKLFAAYMAFANAVNNGADEEEIDDLGDELGKAYGDAKA